MKTIKYTGLFLLALLLPALSACRSERHYTDDLTASELASDAQDALSGTVYLAADHSYLNDYFPIPEEVTDYRIYFASDGNNLDEFGIWHANAATAEPLSALIRGYLDESLARNRSFYDSYIPQETPKLRDAEVRVFGNYVAYAILDEADRKTFFHTVEQDLLGEQG